MAPRGQFSMARDTVEGMRGYIASEHVKWGALVKQLGLEGSQ